MNPATEFMDLLKPRRLILCLDGSLEQGPEGGKSGRQTLDKRFLKITLKFCVRNRSRRLGMIAGFRDVRRRGAGGRLAIAGQLIANNVNDLLGSAVGLGKAFGRS